MFCSVLEDACYVVQGQVRMGCNPSAVCGDASVLGGCMYYKWRAL